MVTTTIEEAYADAFGRLDTVDGSRNLLDIASQYDFSPERLRLFRNGSREFVQYNDISQFTDNVDHWLLSPDAGDSMHIESAESGTYVVNYTLQASWAFQLNQALSDGDVLRFGPYNGTDGWFVEQRGADHTPRQADIKEASAGTETTLAENVDLPKATTAWYRWECVFGWYAVLNQIWTTTYTDDGDVINDTFAKTSRDGDRGPETGNLNLWIEIEAGASTSDLELEAGSMGMITVGDPTSLNRDKPQFEEITVAGTAEAWEPILALRIDPSNSGVNMQLARLNILDYAANDTIELVAASFDDSKTNATDWVVPDYHHAANSALQSTTNVSEVADDAGTVGDFGTDDKFGGYTLASAVDVDGGNVSGTEGTVNQNRQEKKAILNSDHVVFLARTGTMDSVLSFTWDVDQNW